MQMLTLTLVAVSMWMFFIVKWTFQFHQPSTEAVIYSKIKQTNKQRQQRQDIGLKVKHIKCNGPRQVVAPI